MPDITEIVKKEFPAFEYYNLHLDVILTMDPFLCVKNLVWKDIRITKSVASSLLRKF